MKKLSLLLATLALAGCGSQATVSLSDQLKNPLFAEFYYQDLATSLANIEIQPELEENKELLAIPRLKEKMLSEKDDAVANAKDATNLRNDAAAGQFVNVAEVVRGDIMLYDGKLYTHPLFNTPPGPDLHFFLSDSSDPREGNLFEGALDLGIVEQPYGATAMELPASATEKRWKTVLVYDKAIERLYGFAQLSYGPNAK